MSNLPSTKLYLIPTPIGNLEDITLRALRILKEVDTILAEDTRTTSKLLRHYQIQQPLRPFHIHNEHKILPQLIEQLKSGRKMALVSDAGTPAISDPGYLMVRACVKANIEVECLPGPTSIIPALVNSAIPCDRFCFEGFLPKKKGRQSRLILLQEENRTMVFLESPYRLTKTLKDFITYMGEDRQVCVSRELTKMYEENIRGTLMEVLTHFEQHKPKGEIVITLAGKP